MTAASAAADIYDAAFRTRWTKEPQAEGLDYLMRRKVLIVTDLLHDILHEPDLGFVVLPSLESFNHAYAGVGLVVEEYQDKYTQGLFVRECIQVCKPMAEKKISQHALLDILPTLY